MHRNDAGNDDDLPGDISANSTSSEERATKIEQQRRRTHALLRKHRGEPHRRRRSRFSSDSDSDSD